MKTYSELLEDVGVDRLDEAADFSKILKQAENDIKTLGDAVLKKYPKKIRIEDFIEHISPAIKKEKSLSDEDKNKILTKTKNNIKQLAKMAGTSPKSYLKTIDKELK